MGDAVGVADGRSDGVVRAFFRETGASLTSVFVNRNLRRMQLAFAGSLIGNWAYATAVSVWAYGVGGAKAVGIYMAVRLALIAIATPICVSRSSPSQTRFATAFATSGLPKRFSMRGSGVRARRPAGRPEAAGWRRRDG